MRLDERENLELDKLAAEGRKLTIEARKMWIEDRKLRREYAFYPLVAGAAVLTAFVAVSKMLIEHW